MTKTTSTIAHMKRPVLLVRAARHRVQSYRRDRHLPRLMPDADIRTPRRAHRQLLHLEAALNEKRRGRAADYDVKHHIEVLSALMAEAQHLPNHDIT